MPSFPAYRVSSRRVRQLDSKLDRIYECINSPEPDQRSDDDDDDDDDEDSPPSDALISEYAQRPSQQIPERCASDSEKIRQLKRAIRDLSPPATAASPLLSRARVCAALETVLHDASSGRSANAWQQYQEDLEWVLVGKALAQLYAHGLTACLNGMEALGPELGYWDRVQDPHSGWRYGVAYYYLQTAPVRLWRRVVDFLRSLYRRAIAHPWPDSNAWSDRWGQFWILAKKTARDRSLVAKVHGSVMSPLHRARLDAQDRYARLDCLHGMLATTLGLLAREGPDLDRRAQSADLDELVGNPPTWHKVVVDGERLLRITVANVSRARVASPAALVDTVQRQLDEQETVASHQSEELEDGMPRAEEVARMLCGFHDYVLPDYERLVQVRLRDLGRPRGLLRWWLPAATALLASGAALSVLYQRQADVVGWIQDAGTTARDFVANWVVTPIRKTLGTIRHDKDSEIALMSRESLEGDCASLERMVVDFSVDHARAGHAYDDAALADLKAKVREGNLTTVLAVYEQDLRRPFRGTVRGDLIRALLIQIQKTKVDVEVALRGIDNLLKSQELVFA